ncbi:MAG TPA: hypothetical protein VM940_06845 [Chthoniobacterales bacterium]|jgi:hypothetical protein|nr:hypothetical protein [Chthoniobacterales bacterium]
MGAFYSVLVKAKLFALLAISVAARAVAVDFVVINSNPDGPGSLAQAITDANNLPGPDRVVFNIPGAGVRTIDVTNNFLPPITDPLTVDGYTQPGASPNTLATGSNAVVLIRIDGGNTGPAFSTPAGITVNAPDCTIRGLMLTRFVPYTPRVSARFGGFGIESTGDRCVIEGNFLGTDGASTPGLGNEAGVQIRGADYRVGGSTPAARNLIGGNYMGIWATASQRGLILGNHIGRYIPAGGNAGGSDGLANTIGIVLAHTFTDTVVGGTTAAARNFISGNTIGIRTAYTIPTAATTDVGENGIIQGNLIGAEPSAIAGGNVTGIELIGQMHMIGGTTPGAGNVIGSNQIGIKFSSGPSLGVPTENRIFGNDIVANTGSGLTVVGQDNHIGSLAANAGNHIHMNGRGITMTGTPSQQNRILSNIIEDNSAPVPIDLNADGPTSNDFGDGDNGPNRLQNFPIVAVSHGPAGETSFNGELNSAPSSTFTVQLFGNFEGDEQQRLLNTQTVTTDANGFATFEATYPATVEAASVTATATDSLGNTSEMTPPNGPVQLANISTRASVGTGENVMIGGFIIRSTGQKKVAVRALGPSVSVPNRLADPSLEIYNNAGTLVAKNDDWRSGQQQELMDAGLAPSNDLESALIISLPEGGYTAQVRGAHGETGTAVVEMYDLGAWPADQGRLVNLSTRARVGTNDDALIGGLIVRGDARSRVIIRAIGPDLGAAGVNGALQDPTLELRNQNGDVIAFNDNWREGSQEQEIIATGIPPADNRDAAIVHSFFPGSFTAVVRGKNNSTGLALVEFYDLN